MARAELADVYEVRMLLEVQAARLAALRRTRDDVTALEAALRARREAAEADDPRFVDADIALHTAVVTAAHNPVLADLFAQFTPVLRQALIDLVALLDLRARVGAPADASHTGLVAAIEAGDPAVAVQVLRGELEATLEHLRFPS
jgi:DNA-binding FadR family transcriptional regulator